MKLTVITNESNISNVPHEINIPLWHIKSISKTENGFVFNLIDSSSTFYHVSEEDGKNILEYIEGKEFNESWGN